MRLAYADPPYLGQGGRYPEHSAAKVWDAAIAHGDLMQKLDREFDGWAMSASAPSLLPLALMVPAGARIAAWVKPFAAFKANVRCAYTWEPVIFKPGRDRSADGAPVCRDHLSQVIALKKGLVGAKPRQFCEWVLDLLGYVEGDEVVDLFEGTGIMGVTVAQMRLAAMPGRN